MAKAPARKTATKRVEMVKGRFPVTTFDDKGNSVPPGEENTIPKSVADQIEAIHGKYVRPANTHTATVVTADLEDAAVQSAISDAVDAARQEADATIEALVSAGNKLLEVIGAEPVVEKDLEAAEAELQAAIDLSSSST